jgi:predicted DNA binding CopG/RHH family protein
MQDSQNTVEFKGSWVLENNGIPYDYSKFYKRPDTYRGYNLIQPRHLIYFANKDFKTSYTIVKKKTYVDNTNRRHETIYYTIEKVLEHSLKLNGVDISNKKLVARYAEGLVDDFFITLEEMMIEDNYLFHWPKRKSSFMFMAQASNKGLKYEFDFNNKCSNRTFMYIRHIFESTGSRRHLVSKRVPMFGVRLRKTSYENIKNKKDRGRRFLPYQTYMQHILNSLSVHKFIKLYN